MSGSAGHETFGAEPILRLALGMDPGAAAAAGLVRRAGELGLTRFDAAGDLPPGGAWGLDEARRLGAALRASGAAGALGNAVPVLRAGLPGGDRPADPASPFDPHAFVQGVEDLLNALGVPRLALALPPAWMPWWDRGLAAALDGLRSVGAVRRVGFLAPDPATARQALALAGVGFVRGPAGVLEHRFQDAGVFEAAAARGVEVLAVDPLAGGLLWLEAGQGAEPGSPTERVLAVLDRAAAAAGLDRAGLALAYLAGMPGRVSPVVDCAGTPLLERLARARAELDAAGRTTNWARELARSLRRELRALARAL